ncbi:hypothetical protein J4405_06150 [Candidatus Woesearchaeota archaeon]|nr:hypothetical protein [Candidatus Woesearchaeota archaeon]
MCFAPYISLSTFVIEFLLSLFFLLKNPKDNLNRIIALISFLLGIYQLNEFLICTTGLNIFTKLALVTIAILPGLAITYALILLRKKIKWYWHAFMYIPALFFILMFILSNYLKESGFCKTIFIQYPGLGLLGKFFGLYYLMYIVGAIILFYFISSRAKSKFERRLIHLCMLGMFIFTVPTVIFLLFLPAFEIQFASVLCEFALLLAIEFIIVLWYKNKNNLKY